MLVSLHQGLFSYCGKIRDSCSVFRGVRLLQTVSFISAVDSAAAYAAKKMVDDICFVPEVGKLYYGKVVKNVTSDDKGDVEDPDNNPGGGGSDNTPGGGNTEGGGTTGGNEGDGLE